jgi:predicted RNA polymerase sigma factor
MLRLLVLLLLLANGAYFAWSQGLLLAWGQGPVQQSEPHRLEQQIRSETVRILKPDEVRRIETAAAGAPRAPECLATGALDEAQVAALRPLLESWPPATWGLEPATDPPRWIVYMGRYAGVEQVARKKGELRQLGISFENLSNAALEPGLSLGGYASQAAANVVDETLRLRLDELRPALKDKTLRPCR